MAGGSCATNIGEARSYLSRAREAWRAADPEQLNAFLELLALAGTELHKAKALADSGHMNSEIGARSELIMLKREIAQMLRVVDECAAFHRGMAVRLGEAAVYYSATGGDSDRQSAGLHV